MTAFSPAPDCLDVPCTSDCCLDAAIRHINGGWHEVMRPGAGSLALFGNSVSMSNGKCSTRVLLGELEAKLGWRGAMSYASAARGIDVTHELDCGDAANMDVAVIQYTRPSVKLATTIQQRSPRTAMVVIGHCAVHKYNESERGDCARPACKVPTNIPPEVSVVSVTSPVIHLELCGAMRTLLHGTCPEELTWTRGQGWPEVGSAHRFDALYSAFHNAAGSALNTCATCTSGPNPDGESTDIMHFGPAGDRLLGCIISRAILRVVRNGGTINGTAAAVRSPPRASSSWCASQDGHAARIAPSVVSGWSIVDPRPHAAEKSGRACSGNADANAREWNALSTVWRAHRPGAKIAVSTPPATEVTLEMYFHHDLNMGTAHVSVDGRTVARVPTCCTTDCVPSAPGQGFTFRVPVATGLAPVAHEVTIIAEPSNASMCAAQAAARNYQLDLFSVIATNVTRPLKNRHQMGNAQVDV